MDQDDIPHVDLDRLIPWAIRFALRQGGSYDPEFISLANYAVARALDKWTPEKFSMQGYIKAVIVRELCKLRKQRMAFCGESMLLLQMIPQKSPRKVHEAIAAFGMLAPVVRAYLTERMSVKNIAKRFGMTRQITRRVLREACITLCEELEIN